MGRVGRSAELLSPGIGCVQAARFGPLVVGICLKMAHDAHRRGEEAGWRATVRVRVNATMGSAQSCMRGRGRRGAKRTYDCDSCVCGRVDRYRRLITILYPRYVYENGQHEQKFSYSLYAIEYEPFYYRERRLSIIH